MDNQWLETVFGSFATIDEVYWHAYNVMLR